MAVDTANKRYSMIGYDLPFVRVYAEPDGAITTPDMQQLVFKYSGIPFNSGGVTFVPRLPLLGVG